MRVRRADRVEHALLGQALDPVLADRLEHPIARRRRVDDLQERAVDQRGEEVEDLDGRAVVDGRGALRRHAAGEDREPFGERALGVGQELPAPVDDGAQGAVARHRRAAAAGEDLEAIVEAPGELIGRQRAQPGGGQLEGQRLAVQPAADLDDRGDVLRVDGEPGRRRRAAIGEELDRRMGERLVDAGVRAGPGQRRDLDQPLADDAQRLAARRQDVDARAAPEQLVRDGGDVADQVLAVVEDDERGAVGERVEDAVQRVGGRASPGAAARSSSAVSRRPSAARIAGPIPLASTTGASSTSQTPSGASGRWCAPASPASRVFPAPPGPRSVTSRWSRTASATRASSSARPTKRVSGARRFVRVGPAAAISGRRCRGGRRGDLAAQDREVRGLELGAGHGPERVVERGADALVDGQRVGLPAGGVQHADLQPRDALVERVVGGQALELGDELAGRDAGQVGLDAVDGRGQAHVLEPRGRGGRERARARHAGQRRATPQRERLAEELPGAAGLAGAQRARALAGQPLEAVGVDVGGLEREPVAARRLGHERRVAQRPPQPRDERLQRVHLVGGHVLLPDRVDQPAERDRASGVEREPHEQRLQPGPADLDRAVAVGDLERSQEPHAHPATLAGRPARTTVAQTGVSARG